MRYFPLWLCRSISSICLCAFCVLRKNERAKQKHREREEYLVCVCVFFVVDLVKIAFEITSNLKKTWEKFPLLWKFFSRSVWMCMNFSSRYCSALFLPLSGALKLLTHHYSIWMSRAHAATVPADIRKYPNGMSNKMLLSFHSTLYYSKL